MAEAFSISFVLISSLLSFIFVIGIIYLIFYLSRNKEKKLSFTMDMLLKIYLYLMTFITLIVAVAGASSFTNALLSQKYGLPFSYSLEKTNEYYGKEIPEDDYYTGPECYLGEAMEIEGQRVCVEKDLAKKSIINGGSFAISMILLFLIHKFGIIMTEKKRVLPWLKKIYTFASLLVFSLAGVVIIPVSIYQLFTYIYMRPEDITMIDAPGLPLSIMIFVIPLWIVFLISTIRLKEENDN